MYLFPEPTILITGSFYSQGKETTFEIGSENYGPNDFISWFYDLELTACDEPEAVEGAESSYSSGSNYSNNNSGGSSSSISSSNNSGGKYVIRQLDQYDAAGNYIGSTHWYSDGTCDDPYSAGMGGF